MAKSRKERKGSMQSELYATLAELKEISVAYPVVRRIMARIEYDTSVEDEGVIIPMKLVYEVGGWEDFYRIVFSLAMFSSKRKVADLFMRVFYSDEFTKARKFDWHLKAQRECVWAMCELIKREDD